MDDYYVGQCVTFVDLSEPYEYIGLILEVREIMELQIARVLWADGCTTLCNAESLQPLT